MSSRNKARVLIFLVIGLFILVMALAMPEVVVAR